MISLMTVSMDVIRSSGFANMTPVQAGTIPRAIKNQDCVVEVSGRRQERRAIAELGDRL